jgi:hypothetical protein
MPRSVRTQSLPLPGAELARLKEGLATDYGAELWDPDGARVLVVRVPRDEPDIVNDLEDAADQVNPSIVQPSQSLILVGDSRTLILPAHLLRDLVWSRMQFDRKQCTLLRNQLAPGEHQLFKAPEDPRKRTRLAVRLGRPSVKDLDDADLQAAAQELGPRLREPAFAEACCVYLIADRDDVRLDANVFITGMAERWAEETERHQLAEELVRREEEDRRQRETDREALMQSLQDRYNAGHAPRVAVAPLRSSTTAPASWNGPRAIPDSSVATGVEPNLAAIHAHLDALLGESGPRPAAAAPAGQSVTLPAAPAPPVPAPLPPLILKLEAVLRNCGYEVILRPGLAGLDLAAERPGADPERVIAYGPSRLDVELAGRVLQASRDLGAGLALVVCDEADAEARKAFIATRARWLDAPAVEALQL